MRPKNVYIACALKTALICLLGLAIYSNTFQNPFYFDDIYYIVRNPAIKHIDQLPTIFSDAATSPLRFIPFLTFALNYHVSKLDVFGFHVANFLIHIINPVLVGGFSLVDIYGMGAVVIWKVIDSD